MKSRREIGLVPIRYAHSVAFSSGALDFDNCPAFSAFSCEHEEMCTYYINAMYNMLIWNKNKKNKHNIGINI